MKYLVGLLFIILAVVFFKYGTVQKNRKLVTVNNALKIPCEVEFLNVKQGSIAILDETYEPYFSKLQIREIYTLTGQLPPSSNINKARSFARNKFSSAVTTFNEKEKAAILFVTSTIKKILKTNKLDLIAKHPWKFIKIEDWLCGGYAHTRGNYIILSQRHLTHLTTNWSNNMSKKDSLSVIKKLGSLLVHEQFHSLQRQYPDIFKSLYVDSWGFEKINVEIDSDSTILINQLTNPDAPKSEWGINYNDTYYWIRTLIRTNAKKPQMGKDFTDVVFTLEKKNNNFTVQKDSLNNLVKQKLSDFTPYLNSFPVSQGMDHPNEISAYMFSKYFLAILDGEIPFENAPKKAQLFSQEYLSWLNKYF